MKPELLASMKDFMALSGVSERTAKRRMDGMKENHKHVDLWQYCAWYRQNYRAALEYVLTKLYDPIPLQSCALEYLMNFVTGWPSPTTASPRLMTTA